MPIGGGGLGLNLAWWAQVVISTAIFWLIPTVCGFIFTYRHLKKVYHDIMTLWRRHVEVQERLADRLEK